MATKGGSSLRNVVLIGASGALGKVVLKALQEAAIFQITVLTRSSNESSPGRGVKVIQTNYAEDELVRVFQGQDAVISTVGATGFGEQKTFIDAAVKAGVQRFIPSELSTNTLSEAVRELVPVFEVKKAIIEHLKSQEENGLTWTGLAAGVLFGYGLTSGFLGFDLQQHKATLWDEGEKLFSVSTEKLVGDAIVSILSNPDATANRYLYVHSLSTSQKAILTALRTSNNSEWSVEQVDSASQIAQARDLVAKGDFTGMIALVRASAWSNVPGIRSNYSTDEELANRLLGLKEEKLDNIVSALVESN